ncbi:MAG TPA: MauE/DoxX family redox-associated membrane protein [Steroidobacteraceae bacterium]|nr:MauE/DoxX family redox-associated membrane protein [Steroidobacteraceae bacterium]
MSGAAIGGSMVAAVARTAAAQLAAFLALLLIVSAAHKVSQRARTRRAAQQLGGLQASRAALLAFGASAAEAIAGSLLLMPAARAAGAWLAALIWGAYCAALLRALRAGRTDVDCGCSFGSAHRPLGAFQWMRALALSVLACCVGSAAMVGAPSASAAAAFGARSTPLFAGLGLLGVYVALDQLAGLRPLRAGGVA